MVPDYVIKISSGGQIMANQPADNKRLIARLDKAISELETDISTVSTVHPDAASEAKAFLEQVRINYSDATRRIILGDERGSSDLETLAASVAERRVRLLTEGISEVATGIRARINSWTAIWLRDRLSFYEQIDQVQKAVAELRSKVKDNTELANELRKQFLELLDVVKRLEREKQGAQYGIPIKVVMWGIPILVSVIIGRKLNWIQSMIACGFLIFVAVISYVLIRHYRPEAPPRAPRGIRFEVEKITMFIALIIALLPAVAFLLPEYLPDYLMRRDIHLHLDPSADTVAPGSTFDVEYSLQNTMKNPIFGVNLTADAPGLVLPDEAISYNVVGGGEEKTGKIPVEVPQDIPDGVYSIKIFCSFTAERDVFFFSVGERSYEVRRTIKVTVSK